jgi:hypothetical protein
LRRVEGESGMRLSLVGDAERASCVFDGNAPRKVH